MMKLIRTPKVNAGWAHQRSVRSVATPMAARRPVRAGAGAGTRLSTVTASRFLLSDKPARGHAPGRRRAWPATTTYALHRAAAPRARRPHLPPAPGPPLVKGGV